MTFRSHHSYLLLQGIRLSYSGNASTVPLPLLLGPTISSPEALDFEESLVGQMYYDAAKTVTYAYPGGQVWLDFYFSNFI